MKQTLLHIIPLLLMLFLFGCRKDLCYIHDQHSLGYRLELLLDWETVWERPYGFHWEDSWEENWFNSSYHAIRPKEAQGLSVILYGPGNDEIELARISQQHIPIDQPRFSTDEDACALLFYNDDTEYIHLKEMSTLVEAYATTRTKTRPGFSDINSGEATVSQPDMLYSCFIDNYMPQKTEGYTPVEIIMKPLVFTYALRIEIEKGAEHVSMARGALSGMAEGVYLHSGVTSQNAATILFDCEVNEDNVSALVKSFGLPDFEDSYFNRSSDPERAPNILILDLKLNNGNTLQYEFDVTELLDAQPCGGVIKLDGIVVESGEIGEGGSGFEADVDEWGDSVDCDLPLDDN